GAGGEIHLRILTILNAIRSHTGGPRHLSVDQPGRSGPPPTTTKGSSMPAHHGSCHCGAVQFDVEMELSGLATCNCSMCSRSGAILAFVPRSAISGLVG